MEARESTLTAERDRDLVGPGADGMEPAEREVRWINVGDGERLASVLGGVALARYGLKLNSPGGALLALAGGMLVYRGLTGHCDIYRSLGLSTARRTVSPVASVLHEQGIKVEKTVTINKSPEELYRFWRNFENLPRFMKHLKSVRTLDDKRSHWVAKGPAGTTLEWDAEVYTERENEFIAWRSLENADVDSAGSVHFEKVPGDRGTRVKVLVKYNPPAGRLGALIAKLFGEAPEQQIEEDLLRFKQLMEAGEIPTTEGQPAGRRSMLGRILVGAR